MTDEGKTLDEDWALYHRKAEAEKVEVICPLCRRTRVVGMFWAGRGTPRKFCDRCKWWVDQVEDSILDAHPVNDTVHIAGRMAQKEAAPGIRGRLWSVTKYA